MSFLESTAGNPTDRAAVASGSDQAQSAPMPPHRGAFELKFLVDEERVATIMAWADTHLEPDPHSDPETGHGYRVNSLYLDTPGFDVFHRIGIFRRRKLRLRRYGSEPTIWLEQKRKRQDHVRKRRSPVAESDLVRLLTLPTDSAWDGLWFRQRLDDQRLSPVCQISYQRFARVGSVAEGMVRLTIDSDLRARPADGWQVPTSSLAGKSLINGQRIVELKFRETLPTLFRGLIQDLHLEPAPFSKYRTSIAACVPPTRLATDPVSGAIDARVAAKND